MRYYIACIACGYAHFTLFFLAHTHYLSRSHCFCVYIRVYLHVSTKNDRLTVLPFAEIEYYGICSMRSVIRSYMFVYSVPKKRTQIERNCMQAAKSEKKTITIKRQPMVYVCIFFLDSSDLPTLVFSVRCSRQIQARTHIFFANNSHPMQYIFYVRLYSKICLDESSMIKTLLYCSHHII